MFHQLIFKIGQKLKYPLIEGCLKDLMSTDFAPLAQLEEMQVQRMRALLVHAKKNSPFFSKRLKDLDVSNFTLDDLKTIPPMTKAEVHKYTSEIQNNFYNEKLVKSETSGTSGDTLIFYRNPLWDAATRASQMRGYSWYGVKPWERNLYFWGFNFRRWPLFKIRVMDYLVNRFRTFSFAEADQSKLVKYLKGCSYVEGYSSAIYTLAKRLNEKGLRFPEVKLVKGTSEMIYPYFQKVMKQVFGCRMISEYGSAETGIIAFECPEGNMHIAMENVIVEEQDNKVIITNLHSFSFPIIRYELGDYVQLKKNGDSCSCGRSHHIISEVQGRIGKKVIGEKRSYPSFILYYIFKNIVFEHGILLAYFAQQSTPGLLTIQVLGAKGIEDSVHKLVLEQGINYFQDDIKIEVIFLDELHPKQKKLKDFSSTLMDGSV